MEKILHFVVIILDKYAEKLFLIVREFDIYTVKSFILSATKMFFRA